MASEAGDMWVRTAFFLYCLHISATPAGEESALDGAEQAAPPGVVLVDAAAARRRGCGISSRKTHISHGVFSASSAGPADEGPVGRDSGMGKARFAGEVAPRALSSRGKAVFVDSCEFFIEFDGKWESQGHGIAKLIQHSSGSQIFQFWQNKQIWYDDVIRRVGADVLVLKPVGRSGRTLSWMDPDFAGGEYWHAARFPSPELARRFYAVWMGSG